MKDKDRDILLRIAEAWEERAEEAEKQQGKKNQADTLPAGRDNAERLSEF
jgi:hypothetical protein